MNAGEVTLVGCTHPSWMKLEIRGLVAAQGVVRSDEAAQPGTRARGVSCPTCRQHV